jgi:hypothetical protein
MVGGPNASGRLKPIGRLSTPDLARLNREKKTLEPADNAEFASRGCRRGALHFFCERLCDGTCGCPKDADQLFTGEKDFKTKMLSTIGIFIMDDSGGSVVLTCSLLPNFRTYWLKNKNTFFVQGFANRNRIGVVNGKYFDCSSSPSRIYRAYRRHPIQSGRSIDRFAD